MCTNKQAILDKPVLNYIDVAELLEVSKPHAYKWIEEVQCYAKEKGYPPLFGKRIRSADFKEFMRL